MGSRGPQPKQINWDEFTKLVSMQCTQEEIAAWFGIGVDWLDELCQRDLGEKLSDIWDKRKFMGRVRLRKAQFAIMESGGPGAATMAIFLDKKMLPHEQPPPPSPLPPTPPVKVAAAPPKKKTFTEFCVRAGYPPPYERQIEMKDFGVTFDVARMLLGARGYGKSDYVTVLGIAYDVYSNWFDGLHLVKETASTNLIISKSKPRNTAMVEEIAGALIANGVPLEKQNSTVLRVTGLIGKDHSVEVLTIRSSFRGRHPKRIIMDDPVTEEDTSSATRVMAKKKYDEAYKLCANIVIIGQPAHPADLYAELRKQIKVMEVPHGQIPELDSDLAAMKLAGVDENSISMSYHLVIPKSGAMPFSDLRFVDDFANGPSIAFIDPSDGGDFTALSIIRGYMDGVMVQGHAWQRAWYHCDQLVPIMLARGVQRVFFETNKFGTQPLIQLRALLGPHGIAVIGVHSDSNKEAMILAAGSYADKIHLSRTSDKAYVDQVEKYEHDAKYDDAPDSLARGLEKLGLLKGRK